MPVKSREALEHRKSTIIRAAIRILNKKEYSDCPIEDIARAAGIGKGTVYLYFKSKEELYFSIMLNVIGGMKGIVEDIYAAGGSAPEQVRKIFERLAEYMKEHEHLMMVIGEEAKPAHGRWHDRLHGSFDGIKKIFRKIIRKGIAAKEFKHYSPEFMSSVFFALMIAVGRFSRKNRNYPVDGLVKDVSDFFIDGISGRRCRKFHAPGSRVR